MFCPKCGSQNLDGTKFCRGCGADLSNVILPGTSLESRVASEKHLELFSSGVRALIIGAGFFIVSGVALAISMRLAVVAVFFLAFAAYGLGTGISRLIHSRGLRALNKRDEPAALSSGSPDYIRPSHSIYDTEDLIARPLSVTENTTNLLKSNEGR